MWGFFMMRGVIVGGCVSGGEEPRTSVSPTSTTVRGRSILCVSLSKSDMALQ